MRAVAAEETQPARMPPLRSRSIAPLLILIFLVVAAAGAAVWFLILRPQAVETRLAAPPSGKPASAGSSASAGGSAVATAPGPGSAHTGAPPAGSNAAATTTGTNPPPPAPKIELVETVIDANVGGATVEIIGTDQRGTAPLTAKLEKDKPYKARITARGFATSEIDLKGGDAKQIAKLVAKHRFLSIITDPVGALITIDGAQAGRTPAEIELNTVQAAKKSLHLVIRKAGFRLIDRTLDLSSFTEDDTRMSAKLDEKLTAGSATVPGRPGAGTGSVKQPPGSGSDTSSTAGSDTTAPPSGGSEPSSGQDGSAAAPAAPPPAAPSPAAPPPAPAPAGGTGGGSAEPEPEFNKH
jgi:hypothetical protein